MVRLAHCGVKVPIPIALVNVSGKTAITCRHVAQFPSSPNTVIAATSSIQETVVELVHEPAISGR
jgi:hypothetical protein